MREPGRDAHARRVRRRSPDPPATSGWARSRPDVLRLVRPVPGAPGPIPHSDPP